MKSPNFDFQVEYQDQLILRAETYYCEVGEALIGYRGDAGGNLDGFRDCIVFFDDEGHDQVLQIRNIQQIRQVLDTIILEGSLGEKYTDIFLDMLSSRGYQMKCLQ